MRRVARVGKLVLHSINKTSGGLGVLSAFMLMLIVFLVSADVLGRYIFRSPVIWVNEVSLILQVAIAWGGAAYTLRENGHIELQIITERLNVKTRQLTKAGVSFIGFFICIIYVWADWIRSGRALYAREATPTFAMPVSPLWIFMGAGMLIFGLQFIVSAVTALHTWRSLPGQPNASEGNGAAND